ncbi:MAG TPA: rhomboid family intramembrane serine protease [Polyangiaceae bacterium]|nr:rhomboid family intramembrane serine protease [Polyangiaceae bacterium]
MFPLRDRLPSRTTPFVTWLLIAANVLAFLYELAMVEAVGDRFIMAWGLVPARFARDPAAEAVTVLTSMFLHGGWLHLGGNMLFLWIFGDNVEDRLGHLRYTLFYLLAGGAAAAAQFLIDPGSRVPMVGASGAIAGVLGGYVLLYPRARVLVAFPIFFFIQFFELPAWVVIGEWFILQLFNGALSLGPRAAAGGVAFFAHIGGFVAGLVLIKLMAPADRARTLGPPGDDRWVTRRYGPPRDRWGSSGRDAW